LLFQPTAGLPRTFCDKCVAKIKLSTSFKKSSLSSDAYLKSFVLKINQEFNKSLPTVNTSAQNANESTEEEAEIEQMLFDEHPFQKESAASTPDPIVPAAVLEPKFTPKIVKNTPEKIIPKKLEKPKQQIVKIEKINEQKPTIMPDDSSKQYLEMDSAMYNENEEQLDDDGNIFGEEIYDIMEIDQDGSEENIYLDDSGSKVLAEDESEFILVNFKSSNEDLTDKEQFVVEELYDDDPQSDIKPITARKKHVNRMPREIIEKYAQSTDSNQHICTKCVKVFSTRTNLIRHIQSHDGYKAYVCQICNKGFTQSGSLKQHMYIHSGEVRKCSFYPRQILFLFFQRPYKCHFCDRAFTQGKTLKFHLRRHTEEKPFICTECNSAFRQRDGLKRHLKSRHNIELVYERNNQIDEKMLAFMGVGMEKKEAEEEESAVNEVPTEENSQQS
jgi:uncharacterized Zn-finger protein